MSKPSVVTENRTTTERKLRVGGVTWNNMKASHDYPLSEGTKSPEDLAQAKAITGDFQTLDFAKIVTVVTKAHITTTTQFLD